VHLPSAPPGGGLGAEILRHVPESREIRPFGLLRVYIYIYIYVSEEKQGNHAAWQVPDHFYASVGYREYFSLEKHYDIRSGRIMRTQAGVDRNFDLLNSNSCC